MLFWIIYLGLPVCAAAAGAAGRYEIAGMALFAFVLIFLIRRLRRTAGKTAESGAMPGLEYEARCARYLKNCGYRKVRRTPASGDYGADIIAYGRWGKKWVFQCKSYSGKVGSAAVQEVVAAKAHYNADKAAVITNSHLTDKARQLAEENRVVLMEGMDL